MNGSASVTYLDAGLRDHTGFHLLQGLARSDTDGLWRRVLRRATPAEVLNRCELWRLSGLAYRRLVEPAIEEVPRELASALESRYGAIVRDNLGNAEALARIDAAFTREGVRALIVKGMALLESLYRDPGERQMSDIDLVIWPEHHAAAVEHLISLGYVRDVGHPTVFTSRSVTLDVKPEPFGSARIRGREEIFSRNVDLWDSTEEISSYTSLRTWSRPVTIYTQVVHALKHGFPDGVWLTDLGEILQSTSPQDWEKAIRLFHESGTERALDLALMRVEHWGYGIEHGADWQKRSRRAGSTRILARAAHVGLPSLVEAAYLACEPGTVRWSSPGQAFFPNEAVYRRDLHPALKPFRRIIRVADVVRGIGKSVLSRKQGA